MKRRTLHRPPRSSRERVAEIGRTAAFRERQEIIARRAAFAADLVRAESIGPRWQDRGNTSRYRAFIRLPSQNGWRRGDRVMHARFGPGVVLAVETERRALCIAFDACGVKSILESFVQRG
jgi:hypothetical protein